MSEIAEMHIYTGVMAWFFYETLLPFCFILLWSKSPLVYIIFQMLTQSSWPYILPTCCTLTFHLSSMPSKQLPWHFCWGNNFILFTLQNRCTSCCFSASSVWLFYYATHSVYWGFPLGHLCPVYFRKQVYFLLCHPCYLHCISKRGL